jgi:hypothetical protein
VRGKSATSQTPTGDLVLRRTPLFQRLPISTPLHVSPLMWAKSSYLAAEVVVLLIHTDFPCTKKSGADRNRRSQTFYFRSAINLRGLSAASARGARGEFPPSLPDRDESWPTYRTQLVGLSVVKGPINQMPNPEYDKRKARTRRPCFFFRDFVSSHQCSLKYLQPSSQAENERKSLSASRLNNVGHD